MGNLCDIQQAAGHHRAAVGQNTWICAYLRQGTRRTGLPVHCRPHGVPSYMRGVSCAACLTMNNGPRMPALRPSTPLAGSASLPPRCMDPIPIKCTCRHSADRHDYTRTFTVGCGKLDCVACSAQWRRQVRARIAHGASAFPELHFLTLTVQDLPDNPNETQLQMLDRLMTAWRGLRRHYLNRTYDSFPFYRVVESGSKNGCPHLHIVTPVPVPACDKASKYPTKRQWEASLTQYAREFQSALVSAGFGPIYHAERLRYGAAGAVSYLGKYLAKSESKMLLRPDGRKVRAAESSRDFPSLRKRPSYLVGTIQPDRCASHQDWACDCGYTKTPQARNYNNRMSVRRWLAPLDLDDVFCQNFITQYVHHKRRYYYYRSKLSPDWRPAIYSSTRPDLVLRELPEDMRPHYTAARGHYNKMAENLGLLRHAYNYRGPIHLIEYLHRNNFKPPYIPPF